tara:strand:+ start:344 stop:895 length:552 start_codon:yes stop_codon:yes gene_type:complete
MVLTESSEFEKNKKINHFKLKNTAGKLINSEEILAGNGLLVVFTCNHCPYAKAVWNRLIRDYQVIKELNYELIAINPNINPNYPQDSPERMKELINELGLPFEYLIDKNQKIAKLFKATCTPDFFLLNEDMKIIYRGAYDDNWKNEDLVSKQYILDIIKDKKLLENNSINQSIGCSIKWLENN